MNEEEERFEEEQEEQDELFVEEESVEEQPPEDEDVPEKYRGKSLKDLVTMHQESEKLIGRQGSEMGELRKTFDAYIQAQLNNKSPQQVDDEEVDFFEDPNKAVYKTIDKHPEMARMRELNHQLAAQQAMMQLEAKHPDFKEIANDQGFKDWIEASKVRTQMFQKANAYDFDSADELLTLYKERRNLAQQTKEQSTQERKRTLKSASTGSSRGSGESSKRIIYEADIQELILKNHDRYLQMLPEITKAYIEGRVR